MRAKVAATYLRSLKKTSPIFVCRTDLIAVERFLDLFAHRFLCLVLFRYVLVVLHVRQTNLASSLVNFRRTQKY